MPLCQLCRSIDFASLPSFPSNSFHAGLTGKQYIQHYYKARDGSSDVAADAETARRVRYHASIESLREAASTGCDLCALVQREVDALLAELAGLEADETTKGNYAAPTFDMWLTQRPEGGQGFWVISERSIRGRMETIMPIAAFVFVVEADSALSDHIHGRPVKAHINSTALERVRDSLAHCDHDHEGCRTQTDGAAPKRLLDLQSSKAINNDSVRLVETNGKDDQKYVALTYGSEHGVTSCLGGDAPIVGAEIPIASLPKTFQDAISVTRALAMQYLWIDSLCIPGSLGEWRRSTKEAGSVFTNAYATISATGATDSLDGMLLPRAEPKYIQIPYTAGNGTDGTVMMSSLPLVKEVVRTRYIEMTDEPISKGVWSFQERVLSPRVVHFASDQIYVECLQQFSSEDGLRERMRYHTTAAALPEGTKHYHLGSMTDSLLGRWYGILWDYPRREPADPADKLTALSNVARAMQTLMNGEGGDYVAGYWTASFVESLCWQPLKSKPAGDSAAPSWSWASIDGIVATGLGNSMSTHTFATLVGTHVELADAANPFGRALSAALTLSAPPLIPLQLVEETEFRLGASSYRRVRVRSEASGQEVSVGMDTKDRRFLRAGDELQGKQLFALILAESHRDEVCMRAPHDPDGTLHGILVTRADGGNMRRLGFVVADMAGLGPASLLESRENVTLV